MTDKPQGVPLFAAPGHFYSPVGDPQEVRRHLRSSHHALQEARISARIDTAAMVEVWNRIAGRMVAFPFTPAAGFRYYGRNSQFEYYDASILSGLIADLDPGRIVEIGAGFSSAAIFDTIDRMPSPRLRRFTTIDPDMSRLNGLSPPPSAECLTARVQEVPLEVFTSLEAGDVLFIDSSHVLKTGSDVHYEYLQILPALRPGVIVHIHDIFYPFEYPRGWAAGENRSWNEVYLVDMLLSYGRLYEIILFNDAFLKAEAERIRRPGDMFDRFAAFPSRAVHQVNGSLWLRRTDVPAP